MERTIAEELNDKFVPVDYTEDVEIPQQASAGVGIDLGIIKAPTGEGSVGDYLEHPMNFNNSKGMARVLRGLTGMFGSLDLAIVDIVIGALDLLKMNKRAVIKNDGFGDF